MKGVESLALRYVLIILVAALVIGTVFSVMTEITGMAASGTDTVVSLTRAGLEVRGNETCTSFGCDWNSTTQLCQC